MGDLVRIRLKNMLFAACHGVSPYEREVPARIEVDLEVSADSMESRQSDELSETVDYAWAVHEVGKVVEGPSCNLIETLAERIADSILDNPQCRVVTVTVRKHRPFLKSTCDYVEVEVTRGTK